MSTLSDAIAKQAKEQAAKKAKKKTTKKVDESQNRNLCPSDRRWSVWYPQGERIQKFTHRKSNRTASRKKATN